MTRLLCLTGKGHLSMPARANGGESAQRPAASRLRSGWRGRRGAHHDGSTPAEVVAPGVRCLRSLARFDATDERRTEEPPA